MRKKLFQFWTSDREGRDMREITADTIRWEMKERARDMVFAAGRHQKVGLSSVAARLGIPAGRLKKIMYGLAHRIDAWEADRFRRLHQELADLQARREAIEAEIMGVIGGRNEADRQVDRDRHDEGAPEAVESSRGRGAAVGAAADALRGEG